MPNLTAAVRGTNIVIAVGFLMADTLAAVAKRFPKTKFAIIDYCGVRPHARATSDRNVRGARLRGEEAGYLVGSSPPRGAAGAQET